MHYYDHARLSVRKFGGVPEDYLELHRLMDSSKHHLPNAAHRAFSHNTWFIEILDNLMGPTITNSEGKDVPVRDILTEHLKEDHSGKIPTLQDWARVIKFDTKETWMNRPDPEKLRWLKENNYTKFIPDEQREKDGETSEAQGG